MKILMFLMLTISSLSFAALTPRQEGYLIRNLEKGNLAVLSNIHLPDGQEANVEALQLLIQQGDFRWLNDPSLTLKSEASKNDNTILVAECVRDPSSMYAEKGYRCGGEFFMSFSVCYNFCKNSKKKGH